ncbi:hypothetical protein SESBI_28967 [Sesbania bispinosa]|nr:hypothetical protein SESBI_28967 [Sesbania bispinosa]
MSTATHHERELFDETTTHHKRELFDGANSDPPRRTISTSATMLLTTHHYF